MRADRLLSILMLLQTHGKINASQLARELEVSVRTIYRDIDALSTAGIPVYFERGPDGGCSLMEGYRTSLTGLTRDEVKALFMLSIPASLDELGVSQDLEAALRKLTASLPSPQRQDEWMVRQRIYLDWADWPRGRESKSYLQTIHQAVWDNRKLHLTYIELLGPHGEEKFDRLVNPYGLVAKAGEWYLVCSTDGRIHVYHLSRVLKVYLTDEFFERPADFDLIAFWKGWCARQEMNRTSYPVTVRISSALVTDLSLGLEKYLCDSMIYSGPPDNKGFLKTTLLFETFDDARRHVLSFGRAIEVLDPEPLRQSVIDYAKQIVDFYSSKT